MGRRLKAGLEVDIRQRRGLYSNNSLMLLNQYERKICHGIYSLLVVDEGMRAREAITLLKSAAVSFQHDLP